MKNYLKGMLIGMMITSIFTITTISMGLSVEVDFNKIKITVNGKEVAGENILYNGRTYVPLRAISEMLNKDVTWDEKTSTAGVNDKDYKDRQAMPGYSRLNPANLGVLLVTEKNNSTENFKANVKILEIIRGDKAWDLLKKSSYIEEYYKPKEGFDYLLAKINYNLVESESQISLQPTGTFSLVSEDGKEYDDLGMYSYLPEPTFEGNIYQGSTLEGYAVFKVAINDSKPLIAYNREYNGNGGIWFKAY